MVHAESVYTAPSIDVCRSADTTPSCSEWVAFKLESVKVTKAELYDPSHRTNVSDQVMDLIGSEVSRMHT